MTMKAYQFSIVKCGYMRDAGWYFCSACNKDNGDAINSKLINQ
jgi:hypothetical protein